MPARPYKICTRCVMDTSDPLIEFDNEGRCNLCTDFLKNRVGIVASARNGGKTIEELMDEVRRRGRGRRYDCIVGVSGGVDSSFTCALAAEHGLRILAVHLDNGWDSVTSVENIRNLYKTLDIDYASHVLPWAEFRKVQLAFLQASIPEAETPTDVAIQRAVHISALKNGVRTILSGGNIATEGILPRAWHYNCRDTRYSYAILDSAHCQRKYFASQKFGALDEIYYKVIRGIRTLYPLNYIQYSRHAARERLERDHGWKYYGSKHGESGYTKFIQTFYLFVKHGIDYRRATFSSEILLGKIGRDQALAVLETPPFSAEAFEQEIEYICKKLSVPRAEMEDIIAAPPKYFFDYPNNAWALGLLYDLYRKLTGRTKASNF